jgi:hypothetical protein
MKALRTIGILVLVAGLLLGSVGTVFAKGGPPEGTPGKGLKFEGKRHGFAGNVTGVIDGIDGNVTIRTKLGNVTLMLTGETRYKIPGVMNKWEGNLTKFKSKGELGEDLDALVGRRVVALAGNVTEAPPGPFTGEAVRLMLLPGLGEQGLPLLHAHRTGNATDFNPWIKENGKLGNITIVDRDNIPHTFVVDGNTTYRPKEFSDLTGDALDSAVTGSFVTVVTIGDPKLEPGAKAIAKAIVVHRWRQDI